MQYTCFDHWRSRSWYPSSLKARSSHVACPPTHPLHSHLAAGAPPGRPLPFPPPPAYTFTGVLLVFNGTRNNPTRRSVSLAGGDGGGGERERFVLECTRRKRPGGSTTHEPGNLQAKQKRPTQPPKGGVAPERRKFFSGFWRKAIQQIKQCKQSVRVHLSTPPRTLHKTKSPGHRARGGGGEEGVSSSRSSPSQDVAARWKQLTRYLCGLIQNKRSRRRAGLVEFQAVLALAATPPRQWPRPSPPPVFRQRGHCCHENQDQWRTPSHAWLCDALKERRIGSRVAPIYRCAVWDRPLLFSFATHEQKARSSSHSTPLAPSVLDLGPVPQKSPHSGSLLQSTSTALPSKTLSWSPVASNFRVSQRN